MMEKVLLSTVLMPVFKLQDFAIDIINSTHDYWKALVTKKTDGKGISW